LFLLVLGQLRNNCTALWSSCCIKKHSSCHLIVWIF